MDDRVLVCDELCSYATVVIQSHGFMIRTNEEFAYPVDVDKFLGVTVQVHAGPMNPKNVLIKESELNKLVFDQRERDANHFVMVYRAGRTKEQVLDMIQPQLLAVMHKRERAMREVVDNAHMMYAHLFYAQQHGKHIEEFFCKDHR